MFFGNQPIRQYGEHATAWRAGLEVQDENPDYPKSDSGENFFWSVVLFPLNVLRFPLRCIMGIVSAQQVDAEGGNLDEYTDHFFGRDG